MDETSAQKTGTKRVKIPRKKFEEMVRQDPNLQSAVVATGKILHSNNKSLKEAYIAPDEKGMFPRKTTFTFIRKQQFTISLIVYACSLVSVITGTLSLVFCTYNYFISNGIATGIYSFIIVTVNCMLVFAGQLKNRLMCLFFVIFNFSMAVISGALAIAGGVLGVICEIVGMGDSVPAGGGGTMKFDLVSGSLIDRCPSSYFAVRACSNLTQPKMNIAYYIANRQHFIFMNTTQILCGFIIAGGTIYLAIIGIRFRMTIPPERPFLPASSPQKTVKTSEKKVKIADSTAPFPEKPYDPESVKAQDRETDGTPM